MKLNLDYYLTTDERWLRNFSDTLSKITGYENEIRENKLILHPAVGEGMFELATFGDGLSLLRADCIFHTNLKLNRRPDPKNEELIIHFNMSEDPIYADKTNSSKKASWLNFSEAVYYSSSGTGLETRIQQGDHIKLLLLIVDRRWINTNITERDLVDSSILNQFRNNKCVKGILNMDLVDYNLACEILDLTFPPHAFKLHTHGTTLTLLAHFFKKINIREYALKKEISQGTEPFSILKDRLLRQLHRPWPALETLASEHNMSKTKFIQSFIRVFGKNYSQFYLDARMEKSARMILEGMSVSMAGMEVGYTNLGHFSKIFKRYYGISPRQYAKEKELILIQANATVA
ncbi:transcriptional regulator, AraC family [Sphingobacterium spiritivorum ATCC 33300]|uniref:Transcriptional regulator, AraC family n=1 Tax=Sphingobacterium spiritivorum ATCC 33300 TaxID=525372 RepID=C2FYS1_SPHSI|nr:AraC family transcriptional regulator [Sphingobacterium spiritivorum]EEI91906.1 transcriptional regulator, AraC family [Sphingobacterium spiritivorum ATCC 33300]QQS97082.1 helix-turn-helix transcriptional regulator [Sphingobacterium spiritivorum]